MDEYSRNEGHEDPQREGPDLWVDEWSRMDSYDITGGDPVRAEPEQETPDT